jgi:hypothetical protein
MYAEVEEKVEHQACNVIFKPYGSLFYGRHVASLVYK